MQRDILGNVKVNEVYDLIIRDALIINIDNKSLIR